MVESEAEMVEFVSQGWELMKNLNNGKFFLVRN